MASNDAQDLSKLPPIFILNTHLQSDDLHEAEDAVYHVGGRLTYRASEARIFLGKVLHKKRAAFELRSQGVWTQEEQLPVAGSAIKRRKLIHGGEEGLRSSLGAEDVSEVVEGGSKRRRDVEQASGRSPDLTNHIVVLKLEWLDACNSEERAVAFDQYLIYSGRIMSKPAEEKQPTPRDDGITYIKAIPESQSQIPLLSQTHDPTSRISSILERVKADAPATPTVSQPFPFHRRKFGQQSTSPLLTQPHPKLHRATTSEMESGDESKLPPPPAWMTDKHPRPMYSCLRSTFPLEENPNRYFITQLSKIKEARLLTLDEIGVRAYSTSIASLSAYPHRIASPVEVLRLPGCNDKIASLWIDWHESLTLSNPNTPPPPSTSTNNSDKTLAKPSPIDDSSLDPHRTLPTVVELTSNPDLHHLRIFHNIWGVGPDTARKFYLHHGWKELDDIVEFGWSTLTRVQQIGVKFYDEFLLTIPRTEVEDIARTILHHARLCKNIDPRYWTNDVAGDEHDADTGDVDRKANAKKKRKSDPRDFVAILVGGYRRGKASSGDVDIILSHRDERLTQDLIVDIVQSLETSGHITHTLTLHTTTSDRGQQTLPYRADGGGHGFDSLDKALCVWQNPVFDPSTTPDGKNPNVHRRVDIIVSAWRTVGCAVLGWSGGTTFQRDVRRWVKREKGWKFDSSGVRERGTGIVLDLESPASGGGDGPGEGDTWLDREKRVMQRMGIGWRPAGERCTG